MMIMMMMLLLLLGLGHLVLIYHRYCVYPSEHANHGNDDNNTNIAESVMAHIYCVSKETIGRELLSEEDQQQQHQQQQKLSTEIEPVPTNPSLEEVVLVRASRKAYYATIFILVSIVLLVYFGTTLNSLSFEFKGLIEILLKEDANMGYSFVELGAALPKPSG